MLMSHTETTNSSSNSSRSYITITALVIAIACGWFFSDYFSLGSGSIPGQLSNPHCDIRQQACTAEAGGVAITLDVSPRNMHSLQPIDFNVKVNGVAAESALVDLQGTEMYMGINQTPLQQQQPGLFTGHGALGACVTGEMGWRATVLVNTPQGPVKAWFDFRAH